MGETDACPGNCSGRRRIYHCSSRLRIIQRQASSTAERACNLHGWSAEVRDESCGADTGSTSAIDAALASPVGTDGGARPSPASGAAGCWEPASMASGALAPFLEASGSPGTCSGSDFDFFTPSRGSSWQRCPIFLLTQRVHGRSYAVEPLISSLLPNKLPVHSPGRTSCAEVNLVSDALRLFLGQPLQSIESQGRHLGLPNVCSICTLEAGMSSQQGCRVYRSAQHAWHTMIDLSALLCTLGWRLRIVGCRALLFRW